MRSIFKKSLSLPFQYKFLVFSIFAGVFINVIYLSYEAFMYSKAYIWLNERIASCEKYSVIKLACNPKDLVYEPRHQYESRGEFVPDDIEVRKKHALARVNQRMAKSADFERKSIETRAPINILIIFCSMLSLGLLPIFWSFFLKRISDLSKAIRGIY